MPSYNFFGGYDSARESACLRNAAITPNRAQYQPGGQAVATLIHGSSPADSPAILTNAFMVLLSPSMKIQRECIKDAVTASF
jgi:hypothetical protein